MTYRIIITTSAKRDIDAVEDSVRRRLGKKLVHIAQQDDIRAVVKKLVDSRIGDYRIRIGDYRVLCDLEGKDMVILRVQHRKDVYR